MPAAGNYQIQCIAEHASSMEPTKDVPCGLIMKLLWYLVPARPSYIKLEVNIYIKKKKNKITKYQIVILIKLLRLINKNSSFFNEIIIMIIPFLYMSYVKSLFKFFSPKF